MTFISHVFSVATTESPTFNPLLDSVKLLEEFGFFQVVVPLILIFAIFYGTILKTKIFGNPSEENQTWVNPVASIVSFAAAFLVISSTDTVNNINKLVPQSAFLLVGVVLLMMILAITGAIKPGEGGLLDNNKNITTMGIIAISVITFLFVALIDISFGLQIPIIHQLVLAATGVTASGQPLSETLMSQLIGGIIVIGLPIAFVIWVTKSTKITKKDNG